MIKKEKSCPPSIAYANSADAPYIPSPKGRGFTAHFDKFYYILISCISQTKKASRTIRAGDFSP